MINTTRFSILLIAVVYRLTFYLQLRADGFFQLVPVDKKVLLDLSLDQIRGNLPSPLANSSLWFIQLEAILTSLGIGLNGLHLFQFLAGIMLVLTVLTLGQRILGTFPSLFAGAVLAVYGPLLFQEAQIVTAAWTALFLTAAILLPLAFASPPALVFLLSGIIFGLGIQSQANMAISALAFFIGLSTIASQRGKKALFLFPLGILLALAPVTLHNLRSGEFLPLSTVGGVNFFIGNGPGATGSFNIPEGYSLVNEADQFVVSSLIYPEKILGHKPGYSESSRFWISRILRGILSRPARSLVLMGKKTALLLHAWETPNNISYRFFRTQLASIPLPLDFGILVALAIPGFAPVFRRKTARPAI
ncbi:MAG: hypothetical protein P1S46_01715 [bacterium]|nr:hypothetical protein [bacterium]